MLLVLVGTKIVQDLGAVVTGLSFYFQEKGAFRLVSNWFGVD